MKPFSFHELVGELRSTLETFPDPRTGKNRRYSIVDAGYPRKAGHSVTSGLQAPEAETARDGPPGHSE